MYDGECPFCQNFVSMYRIREMAGEVDLINIRTRPDLIEDVRRRGYEINDGMIAVWNGKYYYGSDSVALMSMLSSEKGAFAWMNRQLFGNPKTAARVYPWLVKGRKVALKLMGRKLIA